MCSALAESNSELTNLCFLIAFLAKDHPGDINPTTNKAAEVANMKGVWVNNVPLLSTPRMSKVENGNDSAKILMA